MISQSIQFVRISATQNSFLFIDATQLAIEQIISKCGFTSVENFVTDWSGGNKGIVADGVVFVKTASEEKIDFEWIFYNRDGSPAEMCGNASRAMWVFCNNYLNFKKNNLVFLSKAGPVDLYLNSSADIVVQMPNWKINKLGLEVAFNSKNIKMDWINTGVPHVVIEVEEEMNLNDRKELAKFLRKHPNWGPEGSNITFYTKNKNLLQISAMTFERGVEDFTLSCGTGAVAAAISSVLSVKDKNSGSNPILVDVNVPGGKLKVEVDLDLQKAKLIGEATIDFEVKTH